MLSALKSVVKKYLQRREKKWRFDRVVNVSKNTSKLDITKAFDARNYGFSLSESAAYGLNAENLGQYISTWESYQPRLTDNRNFIVSDDKLLFSFAMEGVVEVPKIYGIIRNGKVQSVSQVELTNENLYDFFLENDGGVLKVRSGYNGYGIHVYTCDGRTLREKGTAVTREDLASAVGAANNCLIQSRVEQGSYGQNLFDGSVNTLRLISVKMPGSDVHRVVAAVQRIGTQASAPMDNFSQGGLSALVDLQTGELSAATAMDSIDEKGNRVYFDRHPDTGAQIKGVVVPNWEQICQSISEITRQRPFFDFVAWDIAVKDDGIAVIETNMKSTLGVFQVHGGMRHAPLGQAYRALGYLKE